MDLYKSIIIPGAFEVNGSIFIEGGQLKSRHDDDAFAEYKLFKGENKLDHNDGTYFIIIQEKKASLLIWFIMYFHFNFIKI